MVIVPVDPNEDEAQNITEKYRNQRTKIRDVVAVRYSYFKHHDGDYDRNNAIAESFQSSFVHDLDFNRGYRRGLFFLTALCVTLSIVKERRVESGCMAVMFTVSISNLSG